MISVVEFAHQPLRQASSEELDSIFDELRESGQINYLEREILRRQIFAPRIFSGTTQDMLKTVIDAAISVDEINASVVPITKLRPRQYKSRRLGGGSPLMFSTERSILVECNNRAAMAVGNVYIEGIRVFLRTSKEYAAAIHARTPKGFHVSGVKTIYTFGAPADGQILEPTAELLTEIFAALSRDENYDPIAPRILSASLRVELPMNEEFTITAGIIVPRGLAGVFALHYSGILATKFIEDSSELLSQLAMRRAAAENAAKAERFVSEKLSSLATLKAIVLQKFGTLPIAKTAEELLSKLSAQQKKIVEAEKNSRNRYLIGLRENTCEHRRIIREILRSPAPKAADISALGKFVPSKASELIDCKRCGFPLICIHLLSELRGEKTDEYGIGERGGVYCKYCGAALPSVKIAEQTSAQDEDFLEEIYQEMLILRRYFLIPPNIGQTKLFRGVRGEIYGVARDLCNQAERSKTSSSDEIKSRRKVIIALCILSWFVHHQSNGGAVHFANFTPQRGKEAPSLLLHCIKITLDAYSAALRMLPSITAETLKTTIISIYRSINVENTDYTADMISAGEFEKFVSREPYYRFLYRALRMEGVKRKFSEIVSPPKKAESVWIHAAAPKKGYISILWKHTRRNLEISAHTEPQYDSKTITKRGKIISMTSELTEAARAAREETREMSLAEQAWSEKVFAQNRRPVLMPQIPQYSSPHFAGQARRRVYNADPEPLALRYDENGSRHKWDILVIGETDYNLAKYCKELPASRPITLRCSVCKKTREEAAEADPAKITAEIAKKMEFENFFLFYIFRCPLQEIHSANCPCGWTGEKSREYYEKYREKYLKDKALVPPAVVVPPKLPQRMELPQFQYNFDFITDLASRLGINYRLLSALGGYERINLEDVGSGAFVVSEVESSYATRIFKLLGYLRALCIEYNQVRNLAKIASPPKKILDFILQYVPRNEFKALEQLPKLRDELLDAAEELRRTATPTEAAEAILQTLCESLLTIYDAGGVGSKFVEAFMGNILEGEALVSKPGYFNWGLIYGKPISDKIEDAEDEGDAGEAGEAGDEEEPDAMSLEAFDVEKDEEDEDEPNLVRLEGIDN